MYSPILKPRNFSDAVIGHLTSLTDSYVQGHWFVIIPLLLWLAIAALLLIIVGRDIANPPNQAKVIVRKNKKANKKTKNKASKKNKHKKQKSSKKKGKWRK